MQEFTWTQAVQNLRIISNFVFNRVRLHTAKCKSDIYVAHWCCTHTSLLEEPVCLLIVDSPDICTLTFWVISGFTLNSDSQIAHQKNCNLRSSAEAPNYAAKPQHISSSKLSCFFWRQRSKPKVCFDHARMATALTGKRKSVMPSSSLLLGFLEGFSLHLKAICLVHFINTKYI